MSPRTPRGPELKPVCPCDQNRAYEDCCGRWHAGMAVPSAEALMRSRYSAFVLGDRAYLLATWHPTTRPATVDLDPQTRWLGLAVKVASSTGADQAEVEFIARYKLGGAPAVRLHERSRFLRENGRWSYVDGDMLA